MGRGCTICSAKDRQEVDVHLRNGESIASISREFRLSPDALKRHKANGHHLDVTLPTIELPGELTNPEDLTSEIIRLRGEVEKIFKVAKEEKSFTLALQAIDRAIKLIGLQGEAIGKYQEGEHITLVQVINQVNQYMQGKPEDIELTARLLEEWEGERNG